MIFFLYDMLLYSMACVSVTLVDCVHIVQQKMELGTCQDSLVSWLCACEI